MRDVNRRVLAGAVAVLLVVLGSLAAPTAANAGTPKKFASCAKLHKKFPYGVAKSRAAATRQYRAGSYRPAVRSAVYRVNKKRLDRDRDGTTCERRRPVAPAPVDPWLHLDPKSMSPLEVMDFETGTSLKATGLLLDDDTYEIETPSLTPATASVSGSGGGYYTDARLVAGQAYTFTTTVETPAHWHCSIYDPNGCTYRSASTEVLTWSFTYTADPGVIHTATPISWNVK